MDKIINETIIEGKIYNMIGIWKKSKSDNSVDSKGQPFLFPCEGIFWTGKEQFIDRLMDIQQYINKKHKIKKKNNKTKCLLCDEMLYQSIYTHQGYLWNNTLNHYVLTHNYEPPRVFIDKVFNCDISIKKNIIISGIISNKFLKLERNQLMILDALMKHGGYKKKYYDTENKNIIRYSEHAGYLDIKNNSINNIIVSGNTSRVDRGDEEIFLPKNTEDSFNYEYIFHTHPPTPKPGGRAKFGILYEFPSMGDIFHFIDHYNDGKVIGSLIMTPEGLYNIRKKIQDKKKIEINEQEFYVSMKKTFKKLQVESIEKYGDEFTTHTFYSVIAQDKTYIKKANDTLEKFQMTIDFFQREANSNGQWIVDTVYIPL